MNQNLIDLLKQFETLLDATIAFNNSPILPPDTPQSKMALLKCLIELSDTYGSHKVPDDVFSLDDMLFLDVDYVSPARWRIRNRLPGVAQRPVNQHGMTFPLLMFLFLRSNEDNEKSSTTRNKEPVFDIITRFIEEIKPHLSLRDFVRTKTGAIRCFTNARFAANRLREFGMLRFSNKEAFKTWELSLTGIIAACALYDRSWRNKFQMTDGWLYSSNLGNLMKQVLHDLFQPETFMTYIEQLYTPVAGRKLELEERDKLRQLARNYYEQLVHLFSKKAEPHKLTIGVKELLYQMEEIPSMKRFVLSYKTQYELADFNHIMGSFFKLR